MAGQSLQKARTFYYSHDVQQYVPHVLELHKSFKKSYQPAFCSKQNQSYDCFNMLCRSEKRPFSHICQGHISQTARLT